MIYIASVVPKCGLFNMWCSLNLSYGKVVAIGRDMRTQIVALFLIVVAAVARTDQEPTCEDHASLNCTLIPGVCSDGIAARYVCPKICGLCDANNKWINEFKDVDPGCVDKLPRMLCLEHCNDSSISKQLCPAVCADP
ncbi:hypothetical protein BaRGS_00023067, partial [Batillaria attramentaria]